MNGTNPLRARLLDPLRDRWRYLRQRRRLIRGQYLEGPQSLNVFVTDRCNLRCAMCANHREDLMANSALVHSRARDMTVDMLRRVLDTFPSLKRATFAGVGEPLLVAGLFDMVRLAGERGLAASLVTNGTLLSRRMAEALDAPLFEVSISINAGDARTYAEITGMPESTFGEVGAAVRELVRRRDEGGRRLRVAVSAVLRRTALEQAPEVARLAASLGVDALYLHNYIPDPARPGDSEEVVGQRDSRRLRQVGAECRRCAGKMLVRLPAPIQTAPGRTCLSFFRNLNVDGEGNVGGCMRVMPPCAQNGNVAEGPRLWTNEYFTAWRAKYLTSKDPLPPSCEYCVENSRW